MTDKPVRKRAAAKKAPTLADLPQAEKDALLRDLERETKAAKTLGYMDGQENALSYCITKGELLTKTNELATARQHASSEIDRLTNELAAMQRNLIAIDGALQVLDQLGQMIEAKGKQPEA